MQAAKRRAHTLSYSRSRVHPPAPTCEDGQPAHGREGVVAGGVQDVQLVHVAADVVNLPVEVLDGGRVLVLEAAVEEAGDNGTLPHPRGAQHHHAVRVLGRHAECAVPAGQGLHHGSGLRQREGAERQEGGGLALQPVLEAVASPVCLQLGSVIAQLIKNLPAVRETWVRSLGWEDPLERGKATHSSILAWGIPRTV